MNKKSEPVLPTKKEMIEERLIWAVFCAPFFGGVIGGLWNAYLFWSFLNISININIAIGATTVLIILICKDIPWIIFGTHQDPPRKRTYQWDGIEDK